LAEGYPWEVAADPLTPYFTACTEFWCKQDNPNDPPDVKTTSKDVQYCLSFLRMQNSR